MSTRLCVMEIEMAWIMQSWGASDYRLNYTLHYLFLNHKEETNTIYILFNLLNYQYQVTQSTLTSHCQYAYLANSSFIIARKVTKASIREIIG